MTPNWQAILDRMYHIDRMCANNVPKIPRGDIEWYNEHLFEVQMYYKRMNEHWNKDGMEIRIHEDDA